MTPCVAAIDCGTTTIKCALLDLSGCVVAESGTAAPLRRMPDGAVEVDADQLLDGVFHSLAACVEQARNRPMDVIGCAVTNQRATVVCLDAGGRPVGPALSWQDMRGAPQLAELRRHISDADYFQLTGLPNFPAFSLAKLLWLRKHEPERYRHTRRFALVHDFVLHGLGCREWITDASNASLTGLLDVTTRQWSGKLLELTELRADSLCRPVEPGTPVGHLSPEAARRTGLPEGLPLIAGAGDQQCAGVGAGAVEPGTVEITLGTVAVPLCVSNRPLLDPQRRVTCCVHAVPGKWNCEGLQNAAGASIGWLGRLLGLREESGFDPADYVQAGAVAPGADGLVFLPYLLGAGAPWWQAEATGTLSGLRATHGRAQVLRAVLEGIARENRAILDVFRELGVPMRDVRLTGGGSERPVWNRIQAGVYDLPVVTLQNPQATLVGAGVLAAYGAGAFASVPEAAACMVRPDGRFEPEPAARPAYAAALRRHLDVRDRLKDAETPPGTDGKD